MPTPRADDAPERFRIALCGERWLEFAALEHETLLPVEDFALSEDPAGDELLVRRAPLPGGGRPLSAARIPRPARAALLLQAAAAAAFFGARGFPLSLEDFEHAAWDGDGGAARFWLTRTPASVRAPAAADAPSPEALRAVVRRLFAGESGRLSPEGARSLAAALEASEATWKRPEHWVASVLRAFPELAAAPAATARERCLGFASEALRSPRARALAEKARAILRGRAPRLFEAGSSPLTPGGALRLLPPADGPADAAHRLRSLAKMTSRRPPSWIAVEPETWDPVSRRAFEAARHSLALARDGHLEVIVVPGALPAPDSPAECRRAAWIPCGSLAGSVRFYEGLSAAASSHPHRARSLIRGVLGGRFWAAFAADPTGDAPLPPALFEAVPSAAPPTRREKDLASRDPGLRIERLLEEGQIGVALREAESWVAAFPNRPAVAWFSLAAHLAARLVGAGVPAPAWLEAIEAEREIVGGRPAEAKGRLERVVRALDADAALRRRCRLRAAEIAVMQGQPGEAARRAAEFRRMHPEAPAAESVRALRLGAAGFSREGRVDCALALLDEAERLGRVLPVEDAVETALARARVFALAGRLEEESAVYESVRPIALGAGDDGLAARFLSQEARGLLDRREHARAIVRFEEAMAVSAADPAERAALALDLSAALYHSGRTAECERALESALVAAASAGTRGSSPDRPGQPGRDPREPMRLGRGDVGDRGAREERAGGAGRHASARRAAPREPAGPAAGISRRCRARERGGPACRRRRLRPARDRRAVAGRGRPPTLRGRRRRRGGRVGACRGGAFGSMRPGAPRPGASRGGGLAELRRPAERRLGRARRSVRARPVRRLRDGGAVDAALFGGGDPRALARTRGARPPGIRGRRARRARLRFPSGRGSERLASTPARRGARGSLGRDADSRWGARPPGPRGSRGPGRAGP